MRKMRKRRTRTKTRVQREENSWPYSNRAPNSGPYVKCEKATETSLSRPSGQRFPVPHSTYDSQIHIDDNSNSKCA